MVGDGIDDAPALVAGVLVGRMHMPVGMLVHQLSVLAVIANATRLLRR